MQPDLHPHYVMSRLCGWTSEINILKDRVMTPEKLARNKAYMDGFLSVPSEPMNMIQRTQAIYDKHNGNANVLRILADALYYSTVQGKDPDIETLREWAATENAARNAGTPVEIQ